MIQRYSLLMILLLFISASPGIIVISDSGQDDLQGDQNDTLSNNDLVCIGILVMQSGFIKDIGDEYIRAFQMVQEEFPDVTIEPIIMDGGSEPSVSVSSWETMKESHPDIPVVITVSSWTTNVVYPDAADTGIVHLALGSAAINRSHTSDRLIRFTPGVQQELPLLVSYLEGFERIAIIGGENDYSREYYIALHEALPDSIVLDSRYDQNNVATTLNITSINEAHPDVILLLSESEGGEVIKLLRTNNILSPIIGTRVIERNTLTEIDETEGLIFTTPQLNESHPFFTRFYEKYGEMPTFYGAEGYDALTTLFSAITECGNSSECIANWYQNRTYDGALGFVQIDDHGVATYPIGFKIVKDGEIEDYIPSSL
ncbi:amino acid/amide ABC transporter substrate-binding protein, HAAT family [Methanospirillum hungatei JF-1]|uniref:Amino acid/amide ABC transporter substrate-binding protein, HAAT family n=1 Tax=Methanospirillum hungatei JF-1 (strain ATCC 27890 / DSM 864 / NBRC 100397 / JF-1) TaxID=323259 RepID=Q2FQG3_METHJ|nr:ABC transporter substrate-binding protein [Methanospirillum hungatei]ABD40447.1 amino acid/amide ABC transporter substrate-binding protein, HAAT family [Methanospirillum hungatei JF-1]